MSWLATFLPKYQLTHTVNQVGGGDVMDSLTLLALSLLVLLIKSFIVQVTLNAVGPKLLNGFKGFTLWESALLIILVNNLTR